MSVLRTSFLKLTHRRKQRRRQAGKGQEEKIERDGIENEKKKHKWESQSETESKRWHTKSTDNIFNEDNNVWILVTDNVLLMFPVLRSIRRKKKKLKAFHRDRQERRKMGIGFLQCLNQEVQLQLIITIFYELSIWFSALQIATQYFNSWYKLCGLTGL